MYNAQAQSLATTSGLKKLDMVENTALGKHSQCANGSARKRLRVRTIQPQEIKSIPPGP